MLPLSIILLLCPHFSSLPFILFYSQSFSRIAISFLPFFSTQIFIRSSFGRTSYIYVDVQFLFFTQPTQTSLFFSNLLWLNLVRRSPENQSFPTNSSTPSLFFAPMKRSTSTPSLNATTNGIERTWGEYK